MNELWLSPEKLVFYWLFFEEFSVKFFTNLKVNLMTIMTIRWPKMKKITNTPNPGTSGSSDSEDCSDQKEWTKL